jgi:hypothetical protein
VRDQKSVIAHTRDKKGVATGSVSTDSGRVYKDALQWVARLGRRSTYNCDCGIS